LYYYFKNKDELIRALLRSALERAASRLDEILTCSDDPREKLRRLVSYYLEDQQADNGFFHIFHQVDRVVESLLKDDADGVISSRVQNLNKRIRGILEEGVSLGYFRQEDPQTLGGIILAMVSGIIQNRSHPLIKTTNPKAFNELVVDIVLKGVRLE